METLRLAHEAVLRNRVSYPVEAPALPNPVKGIELTKVTPRERYLTEDEEDRLLAACTEPLKTIVLLGIYSGLRVQREALTLTWGAVDLKRKTLTVRSAYSKNKATRTVSLNSVLVEALRALRQARGDVEPDDPVFVTKRGEPRALRGIKSQFRRAVARAKLSKEITPHVLRHTFASRLVMAGVDLRTVQELGGWTEFSMVERYSHLTRAHKAQAVEKIVRVPETSDEGRENASEQVRARESDGRATASAGAHS